MENENAYPTGCWSEYMPDPGNGNFTINDNGTTLLNWSLLGDLSFDILSNPISQAITATTTLESAAGTYNLIIEHTTGGPSAPESETFPISVVNNGTSIFALYNQGMADIYIATTPSGSSFIWTLLDGSGNVMGHPSPPSPGVLTLSGSGTPPAQVCIDATLGGCTTRYCVAGGSYSARPVDPDDSDDSQKIAGDIKVYPNPNKGTFNVEIGKFEVMANLQVIDMQGRVISQHTLKKGNNVISKSIPSGMYLLLINVDGELSAHKVEINAE